MMYQIKSDLINAITDNPHWIKRGNNGYFKRCEKDEAEGIVVKGVVYSLDYNNQLEEASGFVNVDEIDGGELILNNKATTSIMFTTMAENGSIDEVTAVEHIDEFEEWVINKEYAAGAIRSYQGKLYRCLQSHTSQSDWTPDTAVSLWTVIGDPKVEYPEWAQPVGAHDAYQQGDKVIHNGIKYVSDVANNVWEPGVYGWSVVTDIEE